MFPPVRVYLLSLHVARTSFPSRIFALPASPSWVLISVSSYVSTYSFLTSLVCLPHRVYARHLLLISLVTWKWHPLYSSLPNIQFISCHFSLPNLILTIFSRSCYHGSILPIAVLLSPCTSITIPLIQLPILYLNM